MDAASEPAHGRALFGVSVRDLSGRLCGALRAKGGAFGPDGRENGGAKSPESAGEERGKSGNRVKQLLVSLGDVTQGLAHNLAGHDAAFAALAGDTERGVNLAQGAGAFLDGGADLGVSDALAETNVHSALWC